MAGSIHTFFTWLEVAELDLPLLGLLRPRGVVLLAEELVEPALVGAVGDQHERREEDEGDDGLPQVHYVGRARLQDDDEPQVREDGERGRDGEHRDLAGGSAGWRFEAWGSRGQGIKSIHRFPGAPLKGY